MRSREYGTQRAAAVNVEVLLGGLPQETDVGMVLSPAFRLVACSRVCLRV